MTLAIPLSLRMKPSRAQTLVSGLRRTLAVRRSIATLEALSDHTLRDIGLRRDEIRPAVNEKLRSR